MLVKMADRLVLSLKPYEMLYCLSTSETQEDSKGDGLSEISARDMS